MKALLILVCITLLSACSSRPLYDELGGTDGLQRVAGHFIANVGADPEIRPYFEHTNLERFHTMFWTHLCEVAGGPCTYEGDDMVNTHMGMKISEAHFNRVVDLLIAAMDAEQVPHPVQNRLLKRLAPLRGDIIYR